MSHDDDPHGFAEGTDRDPHLSVDMLADLDEDLLDTDAADAARHHLDDCPACAGTQAALARLRDALAADDPGPMPDDVLARLEAAVRVAASGAAPATNLAPAELSPAKGVLTEVGHTADAAAAVTLLADQHHRRRPRRAGTPRWLSAAAGVVAIVVIGAGAVAGYQALDRGQHSGTTAAAPSFSSQAESGAAASAGPPVTRSGTDYTAASVASAATRLAAGGPSGADQAAPPAATGAPHGTSSDDTTRQLAELSGLSAGPRLQTCIGLLAEGDETALAVDLARFEGKPAALVVLPTPGDPASVDAWVVGAGCGENGDAQVLYFRRVAR